MTPKDESCVDKKHTVSTEKHAQEKYARYKLIETGERRRPGAFCCDHFYTFSLLVVVVDIFSLFFVIPSSFTSCDDDDWRRMMMKKRRHGFLFISFLAVSLFLISDTRTDEY